MVNKHVRSLCFSTTVHNWLEEKKKQHINISSLVDQILADYIIQEMEKELNENT